MASPENRLLYPLTNSPTLEPEQARLQALANLGIVEGESIPVFEEATQTAAHLLDMPVCILGFLDHEREWLKSAVGLSRLGLMNEIAASRQIPRQDSFCTYLLEGHQILAIEDATTHPTFSNSSLVKRYRIRAYLGVPLISASGHCLGSLAVMDLTPRTFTSRDMSCLELIARWCMSEFERERVITLQAPGAAPAQDMIHGNPSPAVINKTSGLTEIRLKLLAHLTQELKTPLTSVLGMTSVLNRQVYGPLTDKQKEYLDIVYESSQYLLSLVSEIVELGMMQGEMENLNLAPVDLEMLSQQVVNSLEQAAERREQQIRLSIEPGPRIWSLDKSKVRQLLYHLIFNLIHSSNAGSVIRIHVSRKQQCLNLGIWVSHPWLGNGLPLAEMDAIPASNGDVLEERHSLELKPLDRADLSGNEHSLLDKPNDNSRESLSLLLSRCLAEAHGGSISIQGSSAVGFRYVVSLPQLASAEVNA